MQTDFLQLIKSRMGMPRQLISIDGHEKIAFSNLGAPHVHTDWELKFKYNDSDELIQPGLIHYTSNVHNHASFFCGTQGFSISMYQQILVQEKPPQKICEQLINFMELFNKSRADDTDYRKHLYYIILHTIYEAVKNFQEQPQNLVDLPSTICNRAITYILEYYYRPELSVTDIADYAGVSPQYLNKVFHKMGKGSIKSELLNIRMGHAYKLLSTGEYFVGDVAKLTGWRTQFYFSNAFKKYYGFSPMEIRDKKNKGIFNEMPLITQNIK